MALSAETGSTPSSAIFLSSCARRRILARGMPAAGLSAMFCL